MSYIDKDATLAAIAQKAKDELADVNHYFREGVQLAVDVVEGMPEQRWIPCSERLPKEYGNYLITTHNGDVDVGTIDPKKKGVWSACDADGFYWIREVVAWMPLPEPAKLGGD